MGAPFITTRFELMDLTAVQDADDFINEFKRCVTSIADRAAQENLEPVWADAKVGEVPADAVLRFYEDSSAPCVTVPMVGRRG